MAHFFKSLFGGKAEETEEKKALRDFDVLKYDGIRALRIGKTAYAIRCFNEALKLREDKEVLEHLANACVREDRIEEAVQAAGRIVELDPANLQARLLRAHLNFLAENYAEALADCDKALEDHADDPAVYFMQGKVKKAAGDPIGAIVALSQAIRLKADYAEALLLRAEAMLETGDCKDGLEDADEAARLLPEEENVYLVRGRLREAAGDHKAAEEDYRRIKELNPFNEQAYLRLGALYVAQNRPAQAIGLFDEAIELKPDFAKAYAERGRAKLAQGDKEGSLADMKKALELSGEELRQINGTYSNFEEMYANRIL